MTLQRYFTAPLVAYLALGSLIVATRAAYLVHDGTYRQLNGAEMERAAESLARDGRLANVHSDDSGPSAHVPPLYPLFLAGLYSVFGWHTSVGRVAQEVASVVAATAAMLLLPTLASRSGFPALSGWLAAAAMAVLPVNLWIESSGAWEQPYAALVLVLLTLVLLRLHAERWSQPRTRTWAAVLTAVGVMLSPALLPVPAIAVIAELLTLPHSRRQVVRGAAVIALTTALLVAPWAIRNRLVLGQFIPFRSNFGLELALGNGPSADGRTYPRTAAGDAIEPVHPFLNAAERSRLIDLGEVAYMAEKQRAATTWIRENPVPFVHLVIQRARLFWMPPSDMWAEASAGRWLKSWAFSAIGLGALLGLLRLVVRRQANAWVLVACTLGPTLVYMVTHVDPRYRYPVFGLTTMLSAALVVELGTAIVRRRPAEAP